MKVIIAGSRTITDYNIVLDAVLESSAYIFPITEIVSGCARGVDLLGEKYAKLNNLSIKKFPANWNEYGKLAGPIRNRQMAEYADSLIAIWDGKSKGTKNMIDTMKMLNKKFFVKEML